MFPWDTLQGDTVYTVNSSMYGRQMLNTPVAVVLGLELEIFFPFCRTLTMN